MTLHSLQLATEPFEAIIYGIKTIESRIYDDKRKLINIDDELKFINRDSPGQTVSVKVIGLLRYKTFNSLFSHNNPSKFGSSNIEWLENQINEFYSLELQNEYGVLGIEFEFI